jgi:hypothetical protein
MSRLGRPRNATKAEVRVVRHPDRGEIVVKDFAGRPRLVRMLVGRPSLRREARAYRRLAGVRGVPRCFGIRGDALELERVRGRPLSEVPPGELSVAIFDALDALVAAIHARGVAVADLHRSNVLVDDRGGVHLVDFALARTARDPRRPGPLVRRLFELDRHAAARIRARHLGQPAPRPGGTFGFLYRAGRRLKAGLRGRS